MVTSSGYVLQPAITIPANATDIMVGRDGTVSVKLPNVAAPTQVGTLQVTTFVNPAGLESKGENLYAETGASGTPNANTPGTNGAGVILQTYVETSNVNVVEEMVNMITTQRAYEINSKAITTSDQMLQKLSQL
jgi:flagellar basal-body rod protein FlgG